MTSSSEDTTAVARDLAKSHEVVAAVGGDGTVNRVANGVVGTQAILAVIPNGSGNDFASLLGLPHGMSNALDAILCGRTQLLDIGAFRADDASTLIYFVNTLGIGFDAAAAYEAHRVGYLKGLPLYMLGVARALLKFRPVEMNIEVPDRRTITNKYYLACIANGKREGGGFNIAPDASPTDGLLDICLVGDVKLQRIPMLVRSVLSGSHTKNADVQYFKCSSLRLECELPQPVHADGEIYATKCRKLDIEIMPRQLKAIVGPNAI
jgi:YegS/Rv2252/BmrU family lipid kinase